MQIMGHSSYADLAVHSSMASSPDVVLSFLLEMSEIVRPRADEVQYLVKLNDHNKFHFP